MECREGELGGRERELGGRENRVSQKNWTVKAYGRNISNHYDFQKNIYTISCNKYLLKKNSRRCIYEEVRQPITD